MTYNKRFLLTLYTMHIYSLNPSHPPILPALALTIGNFDGVHLGHQAMLATLSADATTRGLATAVMIFEPQPREFFNPNCPPARLTSFDEKVTLLDNFGVDIVIKASFDDAFRLQSATTFTELLEQLNVRHLVLGDDFRFGHDRMGDKQFLLSRGFSVDSLPTISADGIRISSTAIREALCIGDLTTAERLLGRAYSITGMVAHGDKIGRQLGFPTANITLNRMRPALHGIYGADVLAYKDGQLIDLYDAFGTGIIGTTSGSLFGAVNIGMRPSVQGSEYRLEVHLPKFIGNLYGYELQVIFRHFLHEERRYDTLATLQAGIAHDVATLVAWHNKTT